MTLLEVLVALAIASIVFATVFLIYRTAAGTSVRQHDRELTTYAPADTFAALQQDIAGLVPSELDENCALKLVTKKTAEVGALSEISFCAWKRESAAREGMWAHAEKITWRVVEAGTRDARLVRLSSGLTGSRAASVTTNLFLPGIATFLLHLHDGSDWLDAWPPPGEADEKKPARPRTIRIEIALRSGAGITNWSTDFIVPAGLFFTSRVERASQRTAPGR